MALTVPSLPSSPPAAYVFFMSNSFGFEINITLSQDFIDNQTDEGLTSAIAAFSEALQAFDASGDLMHSVTWNTSANSTTPYVQDFGTTGH